MQKWIVTIALSIVFFGGWLALASIATGAPNGTVSTESDSDSVPIDDKIAFNPSYGTALDQQIDEWIGVLAREKGFEEWREATWKRYPLGPGQHGWLVLLSREGKDAGYLVVSGENEKWQLLEYGNGESPLFSAATFTRTLKQYGFAADEHAAATAQMRYAGAFQAVWQVGTGEQATFYDAITGEEFPLDEAVILDAEKKWDHFVGEFGLALTDLTRLHKQVQLAVFDPFEKLSWVDNDALTVPTASAFVSRLHTDQDESEMTFAARLFGRRITVPFAVTGYDEWNNGEVYVRIDHFGERYIPYFLFQQFGEFYGERPMPSSGS